MSQEPITMRHTSYDYSLYWSPNIRLVFGFQKRAFAVLGTTMNLRKKRALPQTAINLGRQTLARSFFGDECTPKSAFRERIEPASNFLFNPHNRADRSPQNRRGDPHAREILSVSVFAQEGGKARSSSLLGV